MMREIYLEDMLVKDLNLLKILGVLENVSCSLFSKEIKFMYLIPLELIDFIFIVMMIKLALDAVMIIFH